MGGYGALRLMAKFPKLFSAASGLSSITNLKDLLPFLANDEQRHYSKKFKAEEVIAYLKKNKRSCRLFDLTVVLVIH
jgi:S-formylglutathione hydrolase FrmB